MIKNKALLGILFFISSLFSAYSCSNEKETNSENSKTKTARVVGYLSTDNFSKMNSIQFCKLTHLNLAFANPDKNGNLVFNGDIDGLIKYVKSVNPNIIICISVAGGVISDEQAKNWSYLIDKPENRPAFIQNIINFVELHHLDGVDVDLEWNAVTTGYSGFVIELKKSLAEHKKIMTAALPNNTRFENINAEALNAFDFLNIMAYDSTGPWTPNKPGQHSSFDFAKEGIDFWHKLQNVPNDKLTLGVPFYGYNFTYPEVTSSTFGQIVEAGTQFAEKDELGKIYYNGRVTIAQKVEYASQNTGGIMIWELAQDSFDEYSLLEVIHKKYTTLKVKTTGLCGN
ncbi:glycosyl hydrolase family 18 protein [Flavobacterium hibernum]|uniref:chitinase n=1 Tax=Flavobacterium hibernum TaxID=37752 RepID=A0A0D0EEB6_9FLAO|nr:glycosyl hydrolase family 18 protein [Flavobacterium hibernum]KIO52069.1 glycoside hydrolase [Flavobacterium hibernum]OXA84110.1 glycoside hydrolase [Flavobacterium hibernum]STO11077.1 Chitinase B precursor [Flavobacterium hibernum]